MTKTSNRSSRSAQTSTNLTNTVPYSIIQKIKGNEKQYQESLETSSSFNKRILNERRMRIPFIDSQTKVAQGNSMIWVMEYQRKKVLNNTLNDGKNDGYIYSYPTKKWYKHRRSLFEANESNFNRLQHLPHHHHHYNHHHHHSHHNDYLNENSNSMDSSNYIPFNTHSISHHSSTTPSSSFANINKETNNLNSSNNNTKQSNLNNDDFETNNANSNNDWATSSASNNPTNHTTSTAAAIAAAYAGLNEDSFENLESFNDIENDSDHDDYEESSKKKKRRGGKPKRKLEQASNSDDKPFVCDRCGVKYKTKPGLTYHIQKAHTNSSSASGNHGTPNVVNHGTKSNDALNPDENTTNSIFESNGFDDVNSSSSLPQISISTNATSTNNQSTNPGPNKCGICIRSELEGRANLQNSSTTEKFISCCDCNKSFHPSCLNFNFNMINSVKKYNWQCIECKRCTHCGNSENDDKLLFCDDCDRGYHMYCLKPALSEAPHGDWRCELCVKQFGSITN